MTNKNQNNRQLIDDAIKDKQSITSDWIPIQKLINGVVVHEVKNIARDNGVLTELYRKEWDTDKSNINHVFQSIIAPNTISAWHVHQETTDRLFVNMGILKIVLYDDRKSSKTFKLINEFVFGINRPALVVIPSNVWHGVHNIGSENSSLINMADKEYVYNNPDHWRLPSNTKKIDYIW